jgi:hypothetical protein
MDTHLNLNPLQIENNTISIIGRQQIKHPHCTCAPLAAATAAAPTPSPPPSSPPPSARCWAHGTTLTALTVLAKAAAGLQAGCGALALTAALARAATHLS